MRHHDTLPTVATKRTLLGWVIAWLALPAGKEFPLPTRARLLDENTAEIKGGDKIGLNRVSRGLKPGQDVIIYKEGQKS